VKLPTFLVIGVQKAGTTSIYQYLQQHPQIYMSPVKETNFFGKDWDKFASETKNRSSNNSNNIDSFEKYCQLFEAATDELALGEVSPNYLFRGEKAAKHIKSQLPEVKTIAILRNPIDRAYSDYLMAVRDAKAKGTSFADRVKYKSATDYAIRKGFYYEQICHFFREFGADRVKVYLYEDLCQDPVRMMQDIYQYIGVDSAFVPDVAKKSQTARIPKNRFINNLLNRENPLRSFAAKTLSIFLPLETRQKIRSRSIELNSRGKSNEFLLPETRQQLLQLYREDILNLQDLIQRDLSAWLQDIPSNKQ
jgi:hypothetical protein